MEVYMSEILGNYILISSFLSWAMAQMSKIVYYSIKNKQFSFSYFVSSGGFPSTHTATVTGLTCGSAIVYGFNSPIFAVSLIFSGVVVYDSIGVRQTTGKLSKKLNCLQLEHPELFEEYEKFDEFTGHNLAEVIAGIIIGVIISIITMVLIL